MENLFRSALFFPFSKFCPHSSAIKLSTQFLPSNSLAIFQIFSFIFSHRSVTFSPSVPIFQVMAVFPYLIFPSFNVSPLYFLIMFFFFFLIDCLLNEHFYSLSSPPNADLLFKKINFTPLNFSPKKCSDSASPTTTPFLPSTLVEGKTGR
uniref:Uncharacterized protein n=1 Tax=Gossypium raimondii TaxID=29730 RepID=A0A0D2V3H5_GOSRA|nr:hypothetical protein B456_012G079100 [Gossypium raimondii]